jgi:gluconate 5-dehydrogenase
MVLLIISYLFDEGVLLMSTQLFSLEGKVALVTGASSGLGVQFAKALGGVGAKVGLLARRRDRLDQVAHELSGLGIDNYVVVADVTDEHQVAAAVAELKNHFGRIDILVNNAGVSANGPAENMSSADWDKVIATNLTAVFTVAREVGKIMIAQGYGKVVNISSMYGVVGNLAFPIVNYHASKAGVVGLTKGLASEWAKYGITVNAIGPGFFESEMTASAINTPEFGQYVGISCPMKRVGKTGELDGAVIYLASDASTYTTGQIICVDGGWTAI